MKTLEASATGVLTLLVVSVSTMLVEVTAASTRRCPDGQVNCGVGRERVVDVVVAEAALVEVDDQGAVVVHAGGGRVELRRARPSGGREREDGDQRGSCYGDPS